MTGKQGPKSEAGKAKSAVNSTVHGLRSNNLSTTEQKQIYDSFLKELIDYYQPESPLEKIQLERIAICRAKLHTLYSLENAKIDSMLREYSSNSAQLLKQFSSLPPAVRGMLSELIRWKTIVLPCNLTSEILEKIHLEIQSFSGVINSEAHLRSMFPELVSYLNSFDSESELDHKLIAISEKITQALARGENYCEFLISRLGNHFSGAGEESKDELSEKQIEFEEQVRQHQLESKDFRRYSKLKTNIPQAGFKDAKHLQKVLKPFTDLFVAYQNANSSTSEVIKFIEKNKSSLTLPQADTDLLLRYQTTWERRLSSSIGEFLRLQEMSFSNRTRSIE